MIRFCSITVLCLSLVCQWAFGTIYLDKSEVLGHLLKTSNFHGFNYERLANNLHFTTIKGKRTDLSQFRGKLVILSFWNINSTDWLTEMKSMEMLLSRHPEGSLEIIALNLVDSIEKIKKFAQSNPTILTLAFDPEKSFSVSQKKFAGDDATHFVTDKNSVAVYEIPRFPTSYLIDQEGMVVGFFSGKTNWNSRELDRFCSSMMDSERSRAAKDDNFQNDARQGLGLTPQEAPVIGGPTRKGPVQAPLGPQAPALDQLEGPTKDAPTLPVQESTQPPPSTAKSEKQTSPPRDPTLRNQSESTTESPEKTEAPKTRSKKKTGSGTSSSRGQQIQRSQTSRPGSTNATSIGIRERQALPVTGSQGESNRDQRTSRPTTPRPQIPLPAARPYYPSQSGISPSGGDLSNRDFTSNSGRTGSSDQLDSRFPKSGASDLPAAQPLSSKNLITGSILDSFGESSGKSPGATSKEESASQKFNQPTTIFQQIGQDISSLGEGIRGTFSRLFGAR